MEKYQSMVDFLHLSHPKVDIFKCEICTNNILTLSMSMIIDQAMSKAPEEAMKTFLKVQVRNPLDIM